MKVHRYSRAVPVLALFKAAADRLSRKIVGTMIDATQLMMREGNWKRGAFYCDHGLRYDPANRHLLKMRQEIADNRITRKASELTGVKGTKTTNGGTK